MTTPTIVSRRRLLQAAAATAGTAGLAGAFLRGADRVAAAAADVDILGHLLVVEDQAVYLYKQVIANLTTPTPAPTASGPIDPLAFVPGFGAVHAAHRDAVAQAVKAAGGSAATVGGAYPAVLPAGKDKISTLTALATQEATILGALYGATGSLADRAVAGDVASLQPVTARFQALLLSALGFPPVPASFVVGDAAAAAAVTRPGPGSASSSSST